MTLRLYNTLTRTLEAFAPIDPENVRMYACGPTVYASPHIGNARSAVVYDVLFRLLRHTYGAERVKYVRNITDVDDKINAAAKERGISIQSLTEEVTAAFHADMDALNCLRPTVEPRATEHIPQMIALIERLIAGGFAYVVEGHVLFEVGKNPHYGCLSRRPRASMIAGARVEIAPYKRDPADFVLWKPAKTDDDPSAVFDSPWGKGRPGWHIECSAMSLEHLGETFDLHGGGADLMFPHHENEIAQSTCALPGSRFANVWVHNGFLTVNGEKMSKSQHNFITVDDLFDRGVNGEVLRYCLLASHYRKPLDYTEKALEDAEKALDHLYKAIPDVPGSFPAPAEFVENALAILYDDLNVPGCLGLIVPLAKTVASSRHDPEWAAEYEELDALCREEGVSLKDTMRQTIYEVGSLLGFFAMSKEAWLARNDARTSSVSTEHIDSQIAARTAAKKAKNFAEADRIRDDLKAQGIVLEDKPDGTTLWRWE